MSLKDIKFTEPKPKDFKCFRLPIDNLPKYKEALIFGNVYNFFGTFIDVDFGFTQTSFSGEGSADNFMSFGQFVMEGGRATIIASKETCNYYRRLYKEFYKAGFGTTHPNVTFFEIDDIKFLTGKFRVKEGKEEKIVKGEYFWYQNKKEEWEFNYLNFIKNIREKGYYINSNMFDLIIANPPYGKRGTLATIIIKEFMKFAEECIVLCQPRSIEKSGVYEHVVKADIVDNIFDAGLGKLAVSKIKNDYAEGKQVLYGKREIQETDITFQIRKFNENKLCWRTIPHCACSPAKYKNLVESKKSFVFFGNFELGNAITEDGESTGYRYNVKKEPVVWAGTVDPKHPEKGVLKNGKDCYAWDCETERSKENFIAVYYDIPKNGFFSIRNTQTTEFWSGRETAFDFCPMINWEHLDESPLWQTSKEKAFLVELIKEGGQKIVLAYLKAKNEALDWSHPWTDQEILKEIGLPEDFLEEKWVFV